MRNALRDGGATAGNGMVNHHRTGVAAAMALHRFRK